MSGLGEDGGIRGLYIIRVREDDEVVRIDKLNELENMLNAGDGAKLERVILPICAVVAFLYDSSLIEKLKKGEYELLPQKMEKMI